MALPHDIRFAIRTLRRNPGYTIAALLTLMLGIGANAAVFSVVYGILMSPLPFPDPDRLVRISDENQSGRPMNTSWVSFRDWRERARSFDGLLAYGGGGESTVLIDGQPARVVATSISEGFTRVMGAAPRIGRPLLAEEHVLHGPPAVLVSDAFWRTHLGAIPDLAGQHIAVAIQLGADTPRFAVAAQPAAANKLFIFPPGHGRCAGRAARHGVPVARGNARPPSGGCNRTSSQASGGCCAAIPTRHRV
jgi:hypothetical protein